MALIICEQQIDDEGSKRNKPTMWHKLNNGWHLKCHQCLLQRYVVNG